MKKERDSLALVSFARRYAWISLVAILITAIAMAALYRELSMRTIVKFGEQGNITVARTMLNAMFPELAGYLHTNEAVNTSAAVANIPSGLLSLFRTSVRDTPIVRIKVYSRNGVVLYSTRENEIGTIDSANPRFQESIRGRVRSKLHYRDALSVFPREADEDNLIETYIPIRQPDDSQPIGVLELYAAVDPIVRDLAGNAMLIATGIIAIMLILYGFLLQVVRRSQRIILKQRKTILDRAQNLKDYTTRLLQFEEAERRRIAVELHEEIAQTLSAVKIQAEARASAPAQSQSLPATTRCEEIVPLVEIAIGDIRALAMDLRSPTLDDFGLVAATRSLCREAAEVSGRSVITADIAVGEEEVPDLLKNVIFRITQQTLKRLVVTPGVGNIHVGLRRSEGLHLAIDVETKASSTSNGAHSANAPDDEGIQHIWERAVLAGGSFSAAYADAGHLSYQATWIV